MTTLIRCRPMLGLSNTGAILCLPRWHVRLIVAEGLNHTCVPLANIIYTSLLTMGVLLDIASHYYGVG